MYHVGGGTHPGAGIPGVLLGAKVTAGLVDGGRPGGARDGGGMSVADAPVLTEARLTTRRVARTFALACRLLPREVRDDVYLLYLVFRTLDDLVDDGIPGAAEHVAAVTAWARGRGRAAHARGRACWRTWRPAIRSRATRSPTSAPACATTSRAGRCARRPTSTSTATRSRAPSAW